MAAAGPVEWADGDGLGPETGRDGDGVGSGTADRPGVAVARGDGLAG